MNKGDIVYFNDEIITNNGIVLTKDCGYEVTHVGGNYVTVYCWVNGYCIIELSELRNDKIDKILNEA